MYLFDFQGVTLEETIYEENCFGPNGAECYSFGIGVYTASRGVPVAVLGFSAGT